MPDDPSFSGDLDQGPGRKLVASWVLLVISLLSGAVVWAFDGLIGFLAYFLVAVSVVGALAATAVGVIALKGARRAMPEYRRAAKLIVVGGALASLAWAAAALWIAYLVVYVAD
jgi:hypothetical protein